MKYMLLLCHAGEDLKPLAAMSPDEKVEMDKKVGAWFQTHGPKIESANRLESPQGAKTVRSGADGHSIVTDGPFAESGEAVGGYAIVNTSGIDEAVEMARAWPIGMVEVRAVMES